MISYKTGSIFTSECDILTCPVNTTGAMGKGLALEFKQKYPTLEAKYKSACGSYLKNCSIYITSISPKSVCFFVTKHHWKDPSKLEYIETGLKDLVDYLDFTNELKITDNFSIALPKLGCGLGGLNWQADVKPLIETYLAEISNKVEIYE
jgi:O-acetyl-ADP-ribose deacetylase (regulator of RNase III)